MKSKLPSPAQSLPNIHESLRALEAAENDMREASQTFCGHKHEAMEITHRAIEEWREAEITKNGGKQAIGEQIVIRS